MTAAELIVLLEGAPPNAVVVTHDGGHDAEEVGARGVEFVLPDQIPTYSRPLGIPDDVPFVRLI